MKPEFEYSDDGELIRVREPGFVVRGRDPRGYGRYPRGNQFRRTVDKPGVPIDKGMALPNQTRSGRPLTPEELDAINRFGVGNVFYPPRGGHGGYRIYPWYEMKVGDSFLMPYKTTRQAGSCVAYGRKATGFKLTTRKTPDGVRVYRIE